MMLLRLLFQLILCLVFLHCTLGQECNKRGQCTNAQISQLLTADNGLDCLKKCQNSDDCKWYTFQSNENDYNCELLRTCEQVDNQSGCVSGQSTCPSEFCWKQGMCMVSFYKKCLQIQR